MTGALDMHQIERRTSISQDRESDPGPKGGHLTAIPQLPPLEHGRHSGIDAFGTRERTISSAIQSFIENKQRKSNGYKIGP